MSTTADTPSKVSSGFMFQAVASFIISLSGLMIGIAVLPIDPWIRGFLAVAALFLVSSTITISKVIRDREEASVVYRRVDQARLEKMLADYDPLREANLSGPPPGASMYAGRPPEHRR
ncbi:hypothetical protein EK0264_00605 [Epidermidibacterium keratini]|uniref:YiaAB two helix domain-containing protein n=1 Tax=Epidermidibacterium keratini TaxID=1891644 RepID=A0A7L4YJ36_9ACTN|nr:YiaA/YiaB family inner membrane protein [Epidermidibacterium keratini]QHB98942.1 hypothetical protein EK0264_00605 [Epidermidibacterium keratini]